MVRYARRRVRRARRTYRRRSRFSRRRYRRRTPTIQAATKRVKLRYCSATNIDPGEAGAVATRVFRCNDLYDPDYTGVGHQPMGFDQWMQFYNHFFVSGSKITVAFGTRNSEQYDVICGIMLSDDHSPMGDLTALMESKFVKWRYVPRGADSKAYITMNFSHSRFFRQRMTDKFVGSSGASPLEGAYFHVFTAPVQAVNGLPVDIAVKIDYSARLLEPKRLPPS